MGERQTFAPERKSMMRALIVAIVVCLIVVLAATAVGRAIEKEMQDHILITQNGETLDCERIVDVQGRVFYDSCVRVP